MLKQYAGFTLFELLLVVALLAIITVLVMPTISQLLTSQRSMVMQRQLSSTLHFARTMAINHHSYVTVCPSINKKNCVADWQQPLIVFIDGQLKATVDDNDRLLRVIQPLAHGQLTLVAFPSKRYFRFTANGFTDNQNGTFYYCYQQQGWQLIVNRAGRLRVEPLVGCQQ